MEQSIQQAARNLPANFAVFTPLAASNLSAAELPLEIGESFMSTKSVPVTSKPGGSDHLSKLLAQYGCGQIQFSGSSEPLYERYILSVRVTDLAETPPREHYEAFARSVRDILSQRWVLTGKTYNQTN